MKKIIIMIWAIGLLFVACTDNDEDVIILPEIPEADLDISIPDDVDENEWAPGMAFQPYPGMPAEAPGQKINVIVLDEDEHGRHIMNVLRNEAWPWWLTDTDKENLKQVCFPPHEDIVLSITEDYGSYNPDNIHCDLFNVSLSQSWMHTAKLTVDAYEKAFPDHFPLIITSAGNGTNTFTQAAWDLCQEIGCLVWEDIMEHFGWDPNVPTTPAQQLWYKPGDVFAAYVVQDPDKRNHAKDLIVVGRDDGHGNKPGPILKERWISTYYSFGIDDVRTDGTSFSTPYVLKIAAEIKRRAPHYTNDEIAQLIFSTAIDVGSPGCDEVYGWGLMNPAKIWETLARRGY